MKAMQIRTSGSHTQFSLGWSIVKLFTKCHHQVAVCVKIVRTKSHELEIFSKYTNLSLGNFLMLRTPNRSKPDKPKLHTTECSVLMG